MTQSLFVLGSARTGLIFTRIQEGAQPGGLTQPPPGQTEPDIPYHVPSRWVPGGRGGRCSRNSLRSSGACGASPVRESGSVLQSVLSCFLLICIVVVTVLFVCCSAKLPLSRPTSFCPFLFILLCTLAGGGAAVWRFCCQRLPKPKH